MTTTEQMLAKIAATPAPNLDRWWAQRWIEKATPGELQAMRELLAELDNTKGN